MKKILLFLFFIFAVNSYAADLSPEYSLIYEQQKIFESSDLDKLKETEIIFIPGIVSEVFMSSDTRGLVDLSFIFGNYLEAQLTHYKKLGFKVSCLKASSISVDETRKEIQEKLQSLSRKKQKALFITHSLGGLVLLDYLATENQNSVKGILFLQSPFYGSPIASAYMQNPYNVRKILRPLMPIVHTNEATIKYLTLESRKDVMRNNEDSLKGLIRELPMLTAGGVSLHYKSTFRTTINLMGYGCISAIEEKCLSKIIFNGPYDDSDGMVPFESSKLPDVDFVKLEGVDHGETVLSMPFKSVDRVQMTDALLKMLLDKI